ELLSETNWCGASLAEIIRRELAPYTRGNTDARGPVVTLKAVETQAVADNSSRTDHQRRKVWRTLQPQGAGVGPMAVATEWIPGPTRHAVCKAMQLLASLGDTERQREMNSRRGHWQGGQLEREQARRRLAHVGGLLIGVGQTQELVLAPG